MTNDADLIQGSDEWYLARAGSLGGSSIATALAKQPGGYGRGASSENLMVDLALERITGRPIETFQSKDMLLGKEREEEARGLYAFMRGVDVTQVGLVRHKSIEWTHSSPDGLVGEDGLVEFKCPNRKTHMKTLLEEKNIDRRYVYQMQWGMACSNRIWCDFVSFNPDFPPNMRFFIHRIDRDDTLIRSIEEQVEDFLFETASLVRKIQRKFSDN